jgi:hypothetical protein
VITQAIKYNRSLTNLDIHYCPIDDEGLDDEGLGSIGKFLLACAAARERVVHDGRSDAF